jgi:hypothetical protein
MDTESGKFQERRGPHREEAESSIALWQCKERRCAWEWKPVATPDGGQDRSRRGTVAEGDKLSWDPVQVSATEEYYWVCLGRNSS